MKIVINACFGGFGLSNRATKEWANRKGWPCFFFKQDSFSGPHYRISDEDAFSIEDMFRISAYKVATPEELPADQNGRWADMTMEERRASNEAWQAVTIYGRDAERNDPDLVAVVELLGRDADARCALLKVIEIPDGTDWEIAEYDGNEHVAQKHETWS